MNEKIWQRRKKAGLNDRELRDFFRIGLSGFVALALSLFIGSAPAVGSDKSDLIKATDPPRAKENLPETCRLKPDRGTCKGLFWMYYFDQKSATCKEFMYGGCDGVVPFETREECEQTCLEQKTELYSPAVTAPPSPATPAAASITP